MLVCALAWADARQPAAVPDAGDALESALRARRPDVLRWETRPVERSQRAPEDSMRGVPAAATAQRDIVRVGRVGPRTAVRFGDGRVRWYAVAGYRPVLVSTHAIESGAGVMAADAITAERDVIGSACEPVSLDAGRRWRATRRLATGDALCASSVAPAPDVERDRAVTLSTERGSVLVSRVLVASADARAGERVRLRDPNTGETVVAIVTGAAAARVLQE